MPVIRTAHNDDYTVMSNYHLRDNNLSLKAKGLLSFMLSLPDDWDYSLSGLASINRESKDAIRSTLVELEKAGYVCRHQTVDSRGKFGKSEYVIYEVPQSAEESPLSENTTVSGESEESSAPENTTLSEESPLSERAAANLDISTENTADSTMLEKSTTEKTTAKNTMQLNKDIQNKEKQNTDSINPSFPFLQVSRDDEEAKRKEMSAEEIENYREVIRYNIDYDVLVDDHPEDKNRLDEVVELLTETVCSTKKYVRIGGSDYPTEAVKARLLQLDMYHIKFVFDCMSKNKTKIRNIRQYLLTALYNAPSTIENYYSAKVNHDLYGED